MQTKQKIDWFEQELARAKDYEYEKDEDRQLRWFTAILFVLVTLSLVCAVQIGRSVVGLEPLALQTTVQHHGKL
jgi:hypothetical protein